MKNTTIGIMAHVDAGKTTLAEAILYEAGRIRDMGRVDHGDAFLDTYALEKDRGITIFSKEAVLPFGTLIDTPGHVDFSPEAERVLSILDYAILVINGTDGIQGHTRTLWRLLNEYGVPAFIFVNKMDTPGADKDHLMSELVREFSEGCVDLSDLHDLMVSNDEGVNLPDETLENIAMLDEALMEKYLDSGELSIRDLRKLIDERKLFPVFFGSALKNEGVKGFYTSVEKFVDDELEDGPSDDFSARVYKISRDDKGTRLTHVRVMSGALKPKHALETEKVDQVRRYDGAKYELLSEAGPGMVCVLTGLKNTYPGQGLGSADDLDEPSLEPVLNYSLILPDEVSVVTFLPKLREIEEEMPELHVSSEGDDIQVRVMGQVQTEILHDLILDRYGVDIAFGEGRIVYKETIKSAVKGIGHYEPLKHYAEAHVMIEPLEVGSGVVADSSVSQDVLDLNWQRLIMTHILEREHPGVLTGSALTDVKITVVGGRSHLKHTEGGDFRQATYRAIRMGLMKAECELLEPYYDFRLNVPEDKVGRAMSDIEKMNGTFTLEDDPLSTGTQQVSMRVVTGYAPVSTMQDYATDVAAYTGGRGSISLAFHGYKPCHNADEVIERIGYDPETDEENPTGSVFCSHGAGYYVPWDEVEAMAHA